MAIVTIESILNKSNSEQCIEKNGFYKQFIVPIIPVFAVIWDDSFDYRCVYIYIYIYMFVYCIRLFCSCRTYYKQANQNIFDL
jgi:hypothetical protein